MAVLDTVRGSGTARSVAGTSMVALSCAGPVDASRSHRTNTFAPA